LPKSVFRSQAALGYNVAHVPRQVGFGHWAEYHIYGTPYKLGKNFPTYEYQEQYLRWMDKNWVETPWMISVDAADGRNGMSDGTIMAPWMEVGWTGGRLSLLCC
jgi:hypothetical protein